MKSKGRLSLVLCFIILVISIGIFLYVKYWQEPVARYLPTQDSRLSEIRRVLADYKLYLRKKGEYACCIRNDCNWCAIYMGHCPCAKMVSKKGNEKSCPECAAAWNRKQGRIEGVDPDAIRVTTFGIYGYERHTHSIQMEYTGKDRHRHAGHNSNTHIH